MPREICFVVGSKKSPSLDGLIEVINQNHKIKCVKSRVPLINHLNIGWGGNSGEGGINAAYPVNKLSEMRILNQKGVKTVPFFEDYDSAIKEAWKLKEKTGLPQSVFGRKKTHTQGRDIIIVSLEKETLEKQLLVRPPRRRDFWTIEIPKSAEYRAHPMLGKVVKVARKLLRSEFSKEEKVRNLDSCTFSYRRNPNSEQLNKLALEAAEAYGVDFAAVDLLKGTDGKYYVLEVNLRPRLSDLMMNYYAETFANQATK